MVATATSLHPQAEEGFKERPGHRVWCNGPSVCSEKSSEAPSTGRRIGIGCPLRLLGLDVRQVVAESPDAVVLVCLGHHLNSTVCGAASFHSRHLSGSVHRSQRF